MSSIEAILQSPAAQPPPGVTANFDNPPNHRMESIAFITVCNIICTFLFFIRVYTRFYIIHRFTLEDGMRFTCLPEMPSTNRLNSVFVVLGWVRK